MLLFFTDMYTIIVCDQLLTIMRYIIFAAIFSKAKKLLNDSDSDDDSMVAEAGKAFTGNKLMSFMSSSTAQAEYQPSANSPWHWEAPAAG